MNVAEYLGECDADEFLIHLAQKLECFPPELFSNPYNHLLKEIEPITNFPFQKLEQEDLLSNLRNELNTIAQKYAFKPNLSALMLNGRWNSVLEQANPNNPEHRVFLAWAYIKLGQEIADSARNSLNKDLLLQGIEMLEKAVDFNPKMAPALVALGWAKLDLARLTNNLVHCDDSIEKIGRALEIESNSYAILALMGEAYAFSGQLKNQIDLVDKGLDFIKRADRIKPLDDEILHSWGIALLMGYRVSLRKEYLEQAIKFLTQTSATNPGDVYNLACAQALSGQIQKCKDLLFKSRELNRLPPRSWMENDPDLSQVRNSLWFTELFESQDGTTV